MINPALRWLMKEVGRLLKGIGTALITSAVWDELGHKPTREELAKLPVQQD